ncbi:MAG: hypothetical protein JW996_00175 [Candidatus Cloacimonetes bacterium]|nr:hypothetical protein [Candidatus Cloacimonadota bacterium]
MIVEISPERAYEIIEKVADFIVKRRMAAAAIMTIESLRPLNYIGSQLMYFLAPFAEIIFNPKEYQEFAALLEKDEYIKLLMQRIDELDEELYREERAEKRKRSKRRLNRFKQFLGIKKKQEEEKNIKNQ